jgi:hypothetical protein
MNTRFPPPWTVDDDGGCLIVRATGGQAVAYVYYFDERQGKLGKLVSREEAEDVAARIVTPADGPPAPATTVATDSD